MSDYLHRVGDGLLAGAIVPVSVRGRLMRRLGYRLGERVEIWSGVTLRSKGIIFGDDVFINIGLFYDGKDRVTVGDRVAFGPFVRLITATHEIGPADKRCTSQALTGSIDIEDGCWLGASVTVLPGVAIRQGCVIGAGATVVRSTEPNGLYVGTPAKRVRDLPE